MSLRFTFNKYVNLCELLAANLCYKADGKLSSLVGASIRAFDTDGCLNTDEIAEYEKKFITFLNVMIRGQY